MTESAISIDLTPESKSLINRLLARIGKEKLYEAITGFFGQQSLIAAGLISRLVAQTLRQRGNLARSIIGRGERIDQVPAVRVGVFEGPSLQYAGVQEYGTKGKNPESPYPTIKPKRAKALAVPIDSSLTASGVPKFDSVRDDKRDLKYIPINRYPVVGKLVVDTTQRARKRAREAFKRAREKAKAASAIAEGDNSKDARATRRAAKVAAANALRSVQRVKEAIGQSKIEEARDAYLLLRKADIEPRHYLRDGFLQYLPKLAANLAIFLSKLIARGDGAAT